jgi:hypothetical protein
MLKLALGIAVGTLLGVTIGALFWARASRAAAAAERERAEQAYAEQLALAERLAQSSRDAERVAAAPERAAAATPAAAEGDGELITERLLAHAREGIARGWSDARGGEAIPVERLDEGVGQFRTLVEEAPFLIGQRLAARETASERALADLRAGGAFALLASMVENDAGPFPELVGDATAFERLFPREAVEHARGYSSGPTHQEEIEDGLTLQYGAGVFAITDFLRGRSPCPKEVTLAGAGMNATLFVARDGLAASDAMRRFEVRDATVLTEHQYAFDHRTGQATIVLTRVRFVGFDMGAGASCCFAFREGGALLARDCRIEGGYGRSPEHGRLFDVRMGGLLARFERCTISGTRVGTGRLVGGATVVFESCQLVDLLDDPVADAAGRRGIVFANTLVERLPAGQTVARRDLNELFPGWRDRIQR